jgi:hypothetical protein
MPGVLPVDNPGRFGAWANGPINDPAASVAPPPSASSTPTSGGVLSSPFGNVNTFDGTGGAVPEGSISNPLGGGGGAPGGGAITPSGGPGGQVVGGYGPTMDGGRMTSPNVGASNNGGSYGVGGQGPGGFAGPSPYGRVNSFDDGGVIDPESDNDENDQQLDQGDPMSVIQNSLGWGRQQMGLPANFFGDQPQATPVGDVVGGPGNWPGNGLAGAAGQQSNQGAMQQPSPLDPTNVIPMPNINKRLQDTAGKSYADGGVIPSQPGDDQQQGNGAQLPDPRKTMAYLAGAGNMPPDAAMALEQRVDPQGQMDPAERKLSAVAAAGTPQAQFSLLQHYRTRFNAYSAAAQAAMDQGNMALAAQHATNAMSNVPNGHSVQFAPAKGGLMMQSKKIGQQQGLAEGGAVDADNPSVVMRSYEDGGQTEDDADENPGGVIPTQDASDTGGAEQPDTSAAPTPPVDQPEDSAMGAFTRGAANTMAPVALAAQSAKGLLQKGWDYLVDKWNAGPSTDLGKSINAAGGVGGALKSGVSSLFGNNAEVQAAVNADQPQTGWKVPPQDPSAPHPSWLNTGGPQLSGAGNQTPRSVPGYRGVPQEQQQQPSNNFAASFQPRQGDPFAQQFNDLRQQAQAMGLRGPEFQKYMFEGMKDIRNNAARLEQSKAIGGIRSDIVNTQQQHGDARNALTNATRAANAALVVNGRAAAAELQTPLRLLQIQANNPGTDLKELLPQASALAAKLGATPQSLIQQLQQQPMQQQQQGGQQAPESKTVNGKTYYNVNGKWFDNAEGR